MRSVDARLLVPAALLWAAVAGTRGVLVARTASTVALHDAAAATLLVGVLLAIVVGGALLVAPRLRAVGVLVLVPIGVAVAAAGLAGSRPMPVAAWVDERATATITGVVTGEPRALPAPTSWGGPQVELPVSAETMAARGSDLSLGMLVRVRLPTTVAVPPAGSRIRAVGRLSASQPLQPDGAELRASALDVLDGPGPSQAVLQAMRDGLRAALAGRPPDAASLVAGLAVGDEAAEPDDLRTAMRASGLAHLTAVSGENVR